MEISYIFPNFAIGRQGFAIGSITAHNNRFLKPAKNQFV